MEPIYISNFFPSKFLMETVEQMWESLPWEERTQARKECFFNVLGTDYTYGEGRGVRTYSPAPITMLREIPWLHYVWTFLELRRQQPFAACFINGYEHHRQHLGWHADDSEMIDHTAPIIVASFGVSREIWTKPKDSDEVSKFLLDHGSVFIMPAGFQQTHLHRIPKHHAECGKRISLTFRELV